MDRLKNFKQYRGRVAASLIFLLFSLCIVFIKLGVIMENPPTIIVNGGYNQNIGTNTGYNLLVDLKDTKVLKINDEKVSISGNSYTKVFDLTDLTGMVISIKALNTQKETLKEVTIIRSFSSEELVRLEEQRKKQEKEIADQKKKEEEERLKQEAYMKSPEYKAKLQKERLNEIISKQEVRLISTCKDGVRSFLKSPSTADFPLFDFEFFILGNQIVIKSYVDSQNAFGAQIRSDFICYYTLGDDNNVVLTDIKF